MAGQQGQPKYGFGWPDGRLGSLGPPGSTTPATGTTVVLESQVDNLYQIFGKFGKILQLFYENVDKHCCSYMLNH